MLPRARPALAGYVPRPCRGPGDCCQHDRRDALFLLAVRAHTWRTVLGKAGQELGLDRMLGATRPGQLSLFRQGLMRFELIPKMREDRLRALAKKFGELLQDHALLTGILGVI